MAKSQFEQGLDQFMRNLGSFSYAKVEKGRTFRDNTQIKGVVNTPFLMTKFEYINTLQPNIIYEHDVQKKPVFYDPINHLVIIHEPFTQFGFWDKTKVKRIK